MSDYQAAWIAEEVGEDDGEEKDDDDEDEDDDMADVPADHGDDDCSESDEEEEAMGNIDSQTEAMTEAGDEDYDAKHVNFAAEVDALEALKNARVDSMFPDEVDTPQVQEIFCAEYDHPVCFYCHCCCNWLNSSSRYEICCRT